MTKPTRIRKAVAAALRERRGQSGHSQEYIAQVAGLHRTYVGSVERGERNVAIEALSRTLRALDWSWGEFGREVDDRLR